MANRAQSSPDSGRRVVLASGNAGKVREISAILADLDLDVLPQSQFGVPEVAETGSTFVENAIIKARNAAGHAGLPAIADDSGIEVDALDGAPGVYSARYAGEGASDRQNLDKLLADMAGVPAPGRGARFHCVMVYMAHPADPTPVICHGVWEGSLLEAPRGTNGFGYDPIFLVPEYACASAELPPDVKNRISHRARAVRLLLERLRSGSRYPA